MYIYLSFHKQHVKIIIASVKGGGFMTEAIVYMTLILLIIVISKKN